MPHNSIPVIETKRLVLRGPEAGDYPDFRATFSSYRSRFMGGPLTPYETWMLYAAEIGHWQIRGYGMWMIHDRTTDKPLGMAGGWKPAQWPEAEIAWIIWPETAGHGYALEATHAARGYLYGRLGWEGAVSYLDPKNLDSIRLAERLGAKKDTGAQTVDGNDICYRHPSPAQLKNTQISDGIELEIAHYADPKFRPEGYALD
ncbi:GNAT family acetyltransferase [Oceanicola sp. 22II-s10i]|uniref:GNAT family N-acetyltransferase n=1 Tax=Oceanicola sp. 22II-s10i TaxID=1317116 RepID=UPI000B521E67|nr:GNAT family N-acetyltransferase [Oceanicola sp. 22II-s10i]OWU85609.1 GNAT family acetyltransferase [Oceanicola sp. 22II-s10i]